MMDLLQLELNKYQTPITLELLSKYPEEVVQWLQDDITNIEFIRWLISKDRPYAKDCPRDEGGRIIVDLTRPHIVENMNYFRQPVLHYMEYGCYTFLKPNSNPHSEYKKFWKEERRRCREGYVRPSDGEWVTGFCYWFLNYNPMMVNIIEKGRKKASRIESFPFFFEGIYWRFHYLLLAREEGKHAIELARRQCAKSYTLSSIMTHNLILGEDSKSKKRVTTILTAYLKEYLKDDKDGTLSKFKPALNFIRANTPFPKLLLKNSPNEMTWLMGYIDANKIIKGSLNTVMGVSAKDDADKLRGKRGWVLFEEMGTFAGLLALYDTTRKGVEDGDYTFATMYLVGTANESESDFSSARTLLYSPDGYNLKSLPNVYDRNKQGNSKFGFFFPAYINRAGCYNKDGVSDIIKALFQIYMARYKAKYSADPKSVLRVIAEDPITPEEAIVKVKTTYFPITALNERLHEIDSNPNFYDDTYIGDLIINKEGVVEFKITDDTPIRTYGVDNSTQGALEIYQMPLKNSSDKVFENRYIIGHDPVDNDLAESSSLSSTFVFDLYTDKIVAEYTGRKPYADDNFELVRRLCLFYNARCCYESNHKGCFAYFAKMNSTHLLLDTPQYLRDKLLVKYTNFGSNAKGVYATAAINNFANDLIRLWLLKPIQIIIKEDGVDKEVTVPNLMTLKNRALIEELIQFTPQLNVDRIRSLGMVMLARQEKIILYLGDMNKIVETDTDELSDDPFFKENYDDKFGSSSQEEEW